MTVATQGLARELDAVVLGAGVAGLYQLHQLRELGLRVRAYDEADDVGGTWWWHDHPGARLDTEGFAYQYLFSEQLYREWGWSERFPAAYEVLRSLRFVADRLDLRRDITLSTRVESAHYDESCGRWRVCTARGVVIVAGVVVSCAGTRTVPVHDVVVGRESFAGPVLETSRWPARDPDLAGRRVGVVGVGTTTVQLVPTLVERGAHPTVFAGPPRAVVPMDNPHYGWQEREEYKARFAELVATLPHTSRGLPDDAVRHRVDATPGDVVRAGMRERLGGDPWLVDVLVPGDDDGPGDDGPGDDGPGDDGPGDDDGPGRAGSAGAGLVSQDTGYLEVFRRGDATLVDLRATPIARIRPEGVELADGTVHPLDVIVLATEHDPGASALARVDVRGRDGRSLAAEWSSGDGRTGNGRTTLGLAKHGYPNLFATAVPMTPTPAGGNTTVGLQAQTEWITRALRDLRADGYATIEPTREGEDAWAAAVPDDLGDYVRRCAAEADAGYPSFTRA